MQLSNIIGNYPVRDIKGNIDIEITGVEHNSKFIEKGNLFIAQEGYTHDGHNYINDAIKKGAVAIVKDRETYVSEGITAVDVIDSTDALGYISAQYYHQPWTFMNTIGITGTNGKTTTSYIIKNILERNNEKVGVMGTMGVLIDQKYKKLLNTTPDSLEIQRTLDLMVQNHIDSCIMEVSSHALEMKRVKYMDFNIGIFTNLTSEHLDYHETMENYFKSKLRLFHKTNKYNVINIDDSYGRSIIDIIKNLRPTITYGIKNDADIHAFDIKYIKGKPSFSLKTPVGIIKIKLKILGEFNIYNSIAAAACCYGLGLDLKTIKGGLESFDGVKGRFEEVGTNNDFKIIIDFAHTPDGIKESLKAIDEFAQGRKVIVFGAGGDRDRSKRPKMGKIAGENSDFVIITSDNPRSENPEDIANDILVGVKETKTDYKVILDRKEAINYAIMNFVCKDTILITGKGHETNMIIKGKEIPFDEREIIRNIIDKM